jgi:hypothetical protein
LMDKRAKDSWDITHIIVLICVFLHFVLPGVHDELP